MLLREKYSTSHGTAGAKCPSENGKEKQVRADFGKVGGVMEKCINFE